MYTEADVYEWIYHNKKLSFEEIDYLDRETYLLYRMEFFNDEIKKIEETFKKNRSPMDRLLSLPNQQRNENLEMAISEIETCLRNLEL